MKSTMKSVFLAAALVGGAALPAAAQQQCGAIVFFPSGQNELGSSASSALQAFLQGNPGASFTVTGYSDAAGSAASNLALSQRRAQSVAAAMSSTTVTGVSGGGEAVRPRTSGPADPANRRVEVVNNACPNGLYGGTATAQAGAAPFGGAGLAVGAGVGALALGALLIDNDDDSGGSTGGSN